MTCPYPTFPTVSFITPFLAWIHCLHHFLALKNFLPLQAAQLFSYVFLHKASSAWNTLFSRCLLTPQDHSLVSFPLWSLLWFLQAELITLFSVSQQHHVHTTNRVLGHSVQFFCLALSVFVTVLFDGQGLNYHLCILTLCYWIDYCFCPYRIDIHRPVKYDHTDF